MRERICKISLFSAILACVSAVPGVAAVKTNNSNRSYAAGYQQVNALRAQQEYMNTTTAAAATLPVMVDDERLANSIVNNETGAPSVSELTACSMIYPNGNFKWGVPEYGIQRIPQCIAVVELRDANSNAVLATTTVAAGQAIKCNIDSFPGNSYNMTALSKIELPADNAPTMEDVIAVMNEEQKQNAGLKIAAGAIIAGVAGNLLAPKDAGTSGNGKIPIGTGKEQLKDTAIGAVTGAGIMAASSYSGKVAGDTIKSTAVNAASGMIVGNMMAGASGSGDIIATTKCSIENDTQNEYDCVVGNYEEYQDDLKSENGKFYIIKQDGSGLKVCEKQTDTTLENCDDDNNPEHKSISSILVKTKTGKSLPFERAKKCDEADNVVYWGNETTENGKKKYGSLAGCNSDATYFEIESAKVVGSTKRAYAIFKTMKLNKALGYTKDDWDKTLASKGEIHDRYASGKAGGLIESADGKEGNFVPAYRDASDGGLVDLSNQARAKGTIVGTAAGGALGGLAGYQGAKDEVSQRWVSAQREYEDSLSNYVCTTGSRFLSKYNDYADIPALKTDK